MNENRDRSNVERSPEVRIHWRADYPYPRPFDIPFQFLLIFLLGTQQLIAIRSGHDFLLASSALRVLFVPHLVIALISSLLFVSPYIHLQFVETVPLVVASASLVTRYDTTALHRRLSNGYLKGGLIDLEADFVSIQSAWLRRHLAFTFAICVLVNQFTVTDDSYYAKPLRWGPGIRDKLGLVGCFGCVFGAAYLYRIPWILPFAFVGLIESFYFGR